MRVHPIAFRHDKTLPPAKPIRVEIFDWILRTFLDPSVQNKVIDLGAGTGRFAIKYRDAGFEVTAVDARTERRYDPEQIKDITFKTQDIRDTDLTGFDVISNLGLFYHLTLTDQIDLMSRVPKDTITILETQIYEPQTVTPKGLDRLTAAKEGGFFGAYWSEPGNHVVTAAWNNTQSFWHGPRSLMQLFRKTGFRMAMPVEPRYMSIYASRGYYILFK